MVDVDEGDQGRGRWSGVEEGVMAGRGGRVEKGGGL